MPWGTRAGLGMLVLQEWHQVGGQEVAGLNLELLSVSSLRQAGRIGLTYLFKTESPSALLLPLTCRCDPQKAPDGTGSSLSTMITKGVMLKNKKDW